MMTNFTYKRVSQDGPLHTKILQDKHQNISHRYQDGSDVGQHSESVEQDRGVRLREPDDSVDEQNQNGYKNISPLPSD